MEHEIKYSMPIPLTPHPYEDDREFGLPIVVASVNGGTPHRFLIDTGADFCMISKSFALLAGLDLGKGEKKKINGVTGSGDGWLFRRVRLNLYGHQYEVPLLVNPRHTDDYGILGRLVLFKSLRVGFRDGTGQVLLGFAP